MEDSDLQIQALQGAKCDVIIVEAASGRAARRGLAAAVASCAPGDTLVVWKLDRLGRDLLQLIEIVKILKAQGVALKILTGRAAAIDITTVEGRALYGIFAAFADLEHGFGIDRTKAGVAVARLKEAGRNRKREQSTLLRRRQATPKRLRCAFNGRA